MKSMALIVIAVSLVLLLVSINSANGATLVVGTGDITSVSAAVEKSSLNDTIRIPSGSYLENKIEITRPVTIIGENWPTIDANQEGMIFKVISPGVTITGVNFVNVPVSFITENAAVLLDGVENCRVIGNTFHNDFFAVYAANSANCVISGNKIFGDAKQVVTAGNGIHVWYCKDMTIENNYVTRQRDGIYFEFVKNSSVRNNHIENNLRYGLHFMFSDSCNYDHNKFIGNSAGVAVMYTRQVVMTGNLFKDSWGGAAYGLLLKDIKDCLITENSFERNSIAIHIDGSDRVRIEKNVLIDNGWAIKLLANCLESEIYDNDFINNSFQMATNSRNAKCDIGGNYWSTYEGYDLDRDGFGDVAYRPVSLYSLLVESNPPTLVLLRSLTISALDLAERIIPTLTPETLLDPKPRMRPIS